MADSDTLIDSAVIRTENLISLAGQNAYAAGNAGWNYKRGVDGDSGDWNWTAPTPKAFAIGDAYQITTPITLPVERPAYVFQPDLSLEFRQAFEEAFAMFHADMEAGLAEYLATWFPQCITTHTDDWICNTILTGGQGIPPDVEALIWQRARSRESEECVRLEQEAVESFAARGFSLPSGVLNATLLRVQQDSFLKGVTLSRDMAIKTFDAYREDVKFAVEQGVKVRLGVLGALGDFIRAWVTPQANATQIAQANVDAKSRMLSTAADYYRAIVSEADLNLRAHQIMQSSYDQTQNLKVTQDFQSEKLGVDAGINTSNVFAQMAVSAANSLVSLVGSEKQLIGAVAS